jgi:hypothetical protein
VGAGRQQRLTSLRLEEFSDRELLALIVDLRNPKGVVTSLEIAEQLDPDAENPVSCVGIRLGWLRRYGVVERVDDGDGPGWRLTSKGEQVAHAGLRRTLENALDTLPPEQGMEAALMLGRLYQRSGFTEATMIRRGWQYASKRKQ